MSLTVERYSDKSYVVRGDTRTHKDLLKENKLRYNGSLNGGPGWIFPPSRLEEVMQALGDKVAAEIIETAPRASRAYTFERQPKGTLLVAVMGTDTTYTLIEMSDDGDLVVDEVPDPDSGGRASEAHTARYLPSLGKWLIASDDHFSLIEIKK